LIENYKRHSVSHQILTAQEVNQRFPQYSLPDGYAAVYQPQYGVLFAAKAVNAHWQQASKFAATILNNTRVSKIEVPSENLVLVHAANGNTYKGKKLIIAGGAWTTDLVKHNFNVDLPLNVTAESVMYFPAKLPTGPDHSFRNLPVCITYDEPHVYLLPQIDVPGVKIGIHHNGKDIINPDQLPNVEAATIARGGEWIGKFMPHLKTTPIETVVCLYTNTQDFHFLIDRLPQHKNVIVCSACSGHGFKFGPAYGKILAAMVLDKKSPVPMELFSLKSDRSQKRASA